MTSRTSRIPRAGRARAGGGGRSDQAVGRWRPGTRVGAFSDAIVEGAAEPTPEAVFDRVTGPFPVGTCARRARDEDL